MNKTKFIVVTGGVLSGLGKGVVTASIGKLLSPNFKVVPIKCDGYLNIDPGTMNPIEHGEVFVLDDGGEVDMDFGHYERFMNISCKKEWSITSGKIFKQIIDKERKGEFLGKTVQMIPHVTDEIKSTIINIAKNEKADFVLIELGGTIGDIEMELFIESMRQMKISHDIFFVHLTYVPKLDVVGEQKTKPTQQSVKILQSKGIQPDIVIARSEDFLDDKVKSKIALFANIEQENVISNPDLNTIYELPIIFKNEGLVRLLENRFDIKIKNISKKWKELVDNIKNPKRDINIAICGKYTELKDSYASIMESLVHAGAHFRVNIKLNWIETTEIENNKIKSKEALRGMKGIIVPGGFGSRGIEGKINVIEYARKNNIPFLGLCYGLQLAVIEFARNVCGLNRANTTEVDNNTKYPIVDILPEQKNIKDVGGTMRLGSYEAKVIKSSKVFSLYNKIHVSERHRHRYEVNPEFHELLEKNGLMISGKSEDNLLAEFIELPNHKFFIATQSHPELKSNLEKVAPLFYGFIESIIG